MKLSLTRAIKLTITTALCFSNAGYASSNCPQQFFNLPVPANVNTCTQLADSTPAALSFFSPLHPQALFQFYSTQNIPFNTKEQHLGRFVMIAPDDRYRVIISPDTSSGNKGSQIDLLIINQ